MPEYVYDVALSFAGTERTYVEGVRTELARWGRSVFYDEDEVVALWGTNLLESLGDIYLNQARYTVMFISAGYANRHWTRHERRMALARALIQREPYVLPVRFDDTSLDGLDPGVAYIPVGEMQPADLARLIVQKLVTAPPPEDDIDQAAGWSTCFSPTNSKRVSTLSSRLDATTDWDSQPRGPAVASRART
jgi:hypothetical protein